MARFHFAQAARRIVTDPGVLFGAVQVSYNAPQSPLYAALTAGSLLTSVGIKAFNWFPRFPMMPLLLAGVSLGAVAVHAAATHGAAAVAIWAPAFAFAAANVLRATELSAKKIWNALPRKMQNAMSGENFAAVGAGLIALFAAGPDNQALTAITALSVTAALAYGMKGRSDVTRLILGANALIAVGAALSSGYVSGAVANAFSAAGSVSLWCLIRRDRGLSVPYMRPTQP